MNKKTGFIQILILVVILAVIALYFGKNPADIWIQYIKPVVLQISALLIKLIEFIIDLVTKEWNSSL